MPSEFDDVTVEAGPLFCLAGDDVKALSEATAVTDVGGTALDFERPFGDRSSVMKKRNDGGPGDEAGRSRRGNRVARCWP